MAAANKADISLREVARGALRKREDPYAADSIELARRIAGTVSMLTALLGAAFLPLAPPDEAIGGIGWVIAIAALLNGFAGAHRLFNMRRHVSFDQLYGWGWLGVLMVGGMTLLAGGGQQPYSFLYGLIVAGSALNPPRRALPFIGACVVVALAPLLYGSSQYSDEMLIASVAVWATVGVLVVMAADGVRHHQLALVRDEREAHELARIDPLTGLSNRRAFDESLAFEIARVRRSPAPLSIALMDLDGLKQINDHHGHLEGDAALRKVAIGISLSVRGVDRVFRWAGDEFAVILPDTTAAEAAVVAERARTGVAKSAYTSAGEPLLISYGVAQLSDGDPAELIDLADAALLAYKSARPLFRNPEVSDRPTTLEE